MNVVYGTITASDGGALKDATVRVCATAACTTAAPGGDGVAMQVDTDATGYFAIRMVPDGDYWVKVMKSGYLSQTLGKFPFSPVLGPVSLNPTLQVVTRKVTVTITTPWANNDLAAAGMKASLTPEEGGQTAYTNVALTAAGSNTFKATFEQVKWGCWTFALSKPTGHLADPGALSGGPPTPPSPTATVRRHHRPEERRHDGRRGDAGRRRGPDGPQRDPRQLPGLRRRRSR